MGLVSVREALRTVAVHWLVELRVIHTLYLCEVHEFLGAPHSRHIEQRGVVLARPCGLPSAGEAHVLVPPVLAQHHQRVPGSLHGGAIPGILRQCGTSVPAVNTSINAAPGLLVAREHAPAAPDASVEGARATRTDLQVELVARHVVSRVHRLRNDVPVHPLYLQPEASTEALLRVGRNPVGAHAQEDALARPVVERGLRSPHRSAPEGPVHASKRRITVTGNTGVRRAVVPSLSASPVALGAPAAPGVEAPAAAPGTVEVAEVA
mmetsp:Transcript_21360/g.59243  ORF Transcript_21360/g.59243 Transcript_21360/m.59243 type:complete len:265 (+) Transcript_21360:391-1185(+)